MFENKTIEAGATGSSVEPQYYRVLARIPFRRNEIVEQILLSRVSRYSDVPANNELGILLDN